MPDMPPTFRSGGARERRREVARLNDRRRGTSASRGYDAAWRRLREAKKRDEPLCRRCLERGIVREMDLVDHIVPIEVAPERRLDWDNLQSMCTDCHAVKTAEDMAIYRAPGERLDPRLLWPSWFKPSAVPLTIVCGAPASGKSTWIERHAHDGDVVIDLDAIHRERTGRSDRIRDDQDLAHALARRNAMLADLCHEVRAPGAFFVVGAPGGSERAKWARMLEPVSVVVIETPAEVCARRIESDPARAAVRPWTIAAAKRWWDRYERCPDDIVVPFLTKN